MCSSPVVSSRHTHSCQTKLAISESESPKAGHSQLSSTRICSEDIIRGVYENIHQGFANNCEKSQVM
jgi:hypothetical protein